MAITPNSSLVSPHAVLNNRTNTTQATVSSFFFSPSTSNPKDGSKGKRPAPAVAKETTNKRVKLDEEIEEEEDTDVESSDEEEDANMMDVDASTSMQRRRTPWRMIDTRAMGRPGVSLRRVKLSTRPILQAFVSSHKSDVYKCQSQDEDSYLTPPYACAYTHAAKRGGKAVLAVATEQGTVHILDTSKRNDWDYEPQRTILPLHANGIFDVQWSPQDTHIATASGDHTTVIFDPSSPTNNPLHTLRGHASTVKCVTWDPTNEALLSTGGRDGGICVWDLRAGGGGEMHPVMKIEAAHGKEATPKGKRKFKVAVPAARTVTSLVYGEEHPYGLVSSGSFDGVLRYWDLRQPTPSRRAKTTRSIKEPLFVSQTDPTLLNETSRRPRGLASLIPGSGPTAGLLFGLSTDSQIYTYHLPTLSPLSSSSPSPQNNTTFSDERMQSNSFYVRLGLSPCGRWLASGCAGQRGSAFLWDVENTGKVGGGSGIPLGGGGDDSTAVELRGQSGEVGAVDWADGCVASCADDGTVRVWRPDIEAKRMCEEDPESAKWDWACAN